MYFKTTYEQEFDDLMMYLRSKYPQALFDLDGIGKQTDMSEFSKNFFASEVTADASVDANANVDDISVIAYHNELPKPFFKLNSYYILWDELRKKHGLAEANKIIEMQLTGDIYIHDFHGIAAGLPYCFNYSTYDIMQKGLPMIKKIRCVPPKHLYSFKSQVEQFTIIAANSTLGATGLADFLVVMSYYVKKLLKNQRDAHIGLKSDTGCWTYVKETLTSFIYTINQPMRGNQCVTEDTEVLTPQGFKHYNELNVGDDIYVWAKDGNLEVEKVQRVNVYDYDGEMHKYEGRDIVQVVTPNHRVFYRDDSIDRYALSESWEIIDMNMPLIIPTAPLINDIDVEYFTGNCGTTDTIVKKSKIHYKGKVWCPTTDAGIVAFRKDGKVFFSGNSPFTNISVYDKYFLEKLKEDYIFPDGETPDIEIVQKLQELYLEIMNEELSRTPLTFPVTTACFSVDKDGNIRDEEFLDFIANQNQKYGFINIYYGDTATLSSCCFGGKQRVRILDGNFTIDTSFKELADGKIDNIDLNDLKIYHKGEWVKGKLVKIPKGDRKVYKIVLDEFTILDATDDHIHLIDKGEVKTTDLTTEHQLLCYDYQYSDFFELRKDITEYKKIQSIAENTDYDDEYVYCFEMENQDEPYFTLANGVITHNCRLRSEQKSEYFNSFGSGSSKIGSLGVCSINLPRLAIKNKTGDDNEEKFFKALAEMIKVCAEINRAKRNIVEKRIANGNLPLYSLDFADLSKQYSTVGVNGFYECIEILERDILTERGQNFALKILEVINTENKKYEVKYNAPHNCEQVPGENMSIKMAQKDKLLKYQNEYDIYSNQFIPLILNADMLDRIKLQGLFDKHFSGGAILHINVDSTIENIDSLKDLLRVIANKGVVYFAINYVLSECSRGHMTVGKGDICSICGKDIINKYTRPVGGDVA